MSQRLPAGQTLMIDADDTLWENSVLFERAIDGFLSLVDHPTLDRLSVRHRFDRLEHARIEVHGYGTASFCRSMLASYEDLLGRPPNAKQAEQIAGLGSTILSADILLLDGVAETLPVLASRHRLILVTKGDLQEQTAKLDRSGLLSHFDHVEVLREKRPDAYHDLQARHGCEAAWTWMIGNSPKSDINPALAAGLHAIFVPHASTWVLEEEPLARPTSPQRLLQIASFRELGDLL